MCDKLDEYGDRNKFIRFVILFFPNKAQDRHVVESHLITIKFKERKRNENDEAELIFPSSVSIKEFHLCRNNSFHSGSRSASLPRPRNKNVFCSNVLSILGKIIKNQIEP